ncbi:hypothetical protein MRX96_016491, partial [Rhipicephalus microplus]
LRQRLWLGIGYAVARPRNARVRRLPPAGQSRCHQAPSAVRHTSGRRERKHARDSPPWTSPVTARCKTPCSRSRRFWPVKDGRRKKAIKTEMFPTVTRTAVALRSPQLWALVANAGVIWATELEWGSLEPMRRMLEVNAVGVARTVRAFLPMVRRAKGGRVVITTSLWGYFSIPFSVAYSMSKCAARFFADGLRREMKKFGVRVVSIEPNMYATNLTADGILLPAMDKLWQETSEEVRRDYGQRYYELSRQYLRRELLKSRTEIHEVVDAMETAVLAQRPRFAYRPDGLLRAFQFRLLEIAPPVVQDAFLIRDTQPPASTLPGNRGIARG